MIFWGLKFWPNVIFWVYERRKNRGIFWVAKKGLRDFLGYANKSSDFLGRQILKLRFFWV